jgi:hypothetical protein
MRKFSGPMGSVGRITIESQALKSNMLVIRRRAWSMSTSRPGTTGKDYPFW